MSTSRPDNVVQLRVPVPVASVQGTLALDLQPRQQPPRVLATPAPGPGDPTPVDVRRRREVERWAHRFAQAAVEIVGGDRPATQLLRWTTGEVYADLQRRALLVARGGGHQPATARVQPVRPQVLSIHSCFVDRGVVETSVHVRYGERSRALAARFELKRTRHEATPRWICTTLQWA
ncbi:MULTISPECIES: Rv3235 family protein [unclassified Nocardioides]|uniref:Rv3235 family protein n=1 Tax=unclassified Nocardioides TaxID=2615069 RepID=UPI003014510F